MTGETVASVYLTEEEVTNQLDVKGGRLLFVDRHNPYILFQFVLFVFVQFNVHVSGLRD